MKLFSTHIVTYTLLLVAISNASFVNQHPIGCIKMRHALPFNVTHFKYQQPPGLVYQAAGKIRSPASRQ